MIHIVRLIERARSEFVEMPGLALTLPQAARLWNLAPDDCRAVIDVLTASGFLRWTAARTVVRTGRELVIAGAWKDRDDDGDPYVYVGSLEQSDKSVARL